MTQIAPDEEGARRSRVVGAGFMIAAGLQFIAMDTASKAMVADYSFMQITWGRYFFHMLPIVIWIAIRRRPGIVRTHRPGLQLVRSALLFVSSAVFVLALNYLPLADTVTLNYTGPLLVTALSVPLLGEKVGWRRWAAVFVGFLGVLVVVRPGFAEVHWAVVLPLTTATVFAFYHIATRLLAGTDDPMTTILWSSFVGTAISTACLPFVWTPPDLWGWVGLIAIGALGASGHLSFIHAFSHAPPSFLAPLTYLGLIWATLLGWILFDHLPDGPTFLGMAIIAGSGLYILYRESVRRRERKGR